MPRSVRLLNWLGPEERTVLQYGVGALVLCASLAGCATGTALRSGRSAEQQKDYDRAVVEYARALRLDPDSEEARRALARAKLRAALNHFANGRRLASTGNLEEAFVEYQLASELNPTSGEISEELQATRNSLRARVAVTRDGKTELESVVERARDLSPPGFEIPATAALPASLEFRAASSRDIITALARFAGVNVVFDPDFRESTVSADLRHSTFEQALSLMTSSTQTFFRVTGPRTISVIPDTPAKRTEYEDQIVRTFYLSNIELKEAINLLRVVIDARRVSPMTAIKALTISDTPERIAAAAKLLYAVDKARPEVIIDVELLEVDRTRLKEYGLELGSLGISGSVDVNRDGLTLEGLRSVGPSQVFLSSLPGLYYRLLKTNAATRTLAHPQLRTSDSVPAQASFGERIPVPVTTFSPLGTGGIAQQPITSFNYQNIGVNIDITPRTHHDNDVTLALKIEVSSISGTGFGNLPMFASRSVSTSIRLEDGETNMLAGLIRDDERQGLNSVLGLGDVPVSRRLFGHSTHESQETDVILTLTPHIIRVLSLSDGDLQAFRAGHGISGPLVQPLPDVFR